MKTEEKTSTFLNQLVRKTVLVSIMYFSRLNYPQEKKYTCLNLIVIHMLIPYFQTKSPLLDKNRLREASHLNNFSKPSSEIKAATADFSRSLAVLGKYTYFTLPPTFPHSISNLSLASLALLLLVIIIIIITN